MFKKLLPIFCLLLTVSVLKADKLWLLDGSVLVGEIGLLLDGKVSLKSASAGELKIEQSQILKIETEGSFNGLLQNEQRISGRLLPGDDGQLLIAGGSGSFALQDLKALWGEGAADPTLPEPPKGRVWSGEAYVDVSGKTGNTEKFTGGAGLKTTLVGPEDRLLLYLNGSYARENSNTNEKAYRGGFDYEHSIAQSLNSWFVRGEIEKDKYSGLEWRKQLVAGYGYFFFKEETTELRLRIGASIQRKEYEDGEADNAYGLDVNLHYERQIDEWGTLISDLTYTPGLNNYDDYRIYHESALDIPLLFSKPLSLRLGISNEYNNLVSDDAKRMDTTYFAKLVYKWK
ncbi:MAG: DUF481 domain-containing protein [Oligosphaeraceae bacterium]|nr:DUF481 domain-containing protein [Oligosphaeraceae bacterium]